MGRKLTALILLGSMLACTSVRPVASPAAFIPQRAPEVVWVTNSDGETFQLIRPTVRGDSIVGTLAQTAEPFALPLTPDHRVFARQKSTGKTLQLVGVIGLVTGLAVWGFIAGGNAPHGCAQPGMRGCPPQ